LNLLRQRVDPELSHAETDGYSNNDEAFGFIDGTVCFEIVTLGAKRWGTHCRMCNGLGERGKGGRGGTPACSTRSRYLGDVARSSSLSAGTRFALPNHYSMPSERSELVKVEPLCPQRVVESRPPSGEAREETNPAAILQLANQLWVYLGNVGRTNPGRRRELQHHTFGGHCERGLASIRPTDVDLRKVYRTICNNYSR
jgi:hypothetical protein